MNSTDDDLITLRLSTAQFAQRDAVEAFRETFGRTILRIDMEPLQDNVLEADLTLRAFSGVGLASGSLSPMRNRHGPDLIDNDDLVLVFMQEGFGALEQHNRRTEVPPGGVVLTDNGAAGTFMAPAAVRLINLRLSRAQLTSHIPDLGEALVAPSIADSPALRLLRSYALSLNDEGALKTPELRRAVATHMHDLAALAIGATGGDAELATLRGVRAARFRAIKVDVATNIGDVNLSADVVAARHSITPRYMRMLFEAEGKSFSEFVLFHRLQRAHRLLADTRHLAITISTIAFESGFSDLSYFNRTFRRRYGLTPSDVRAKARGLN